MISICINNTVGGLMMNERGKDGVDGVSGKAGSRAEGVIGNGALGARKEPLESSSPIYRMSIGGRS
jgi:hypothetical protein